MKVHSRHNSKQKRPRAIAGVFLVGCVVLALGFLLPYVLSGVSRVFLYPFHVTNSWFAQSSSRLPLYLKEQDELIETIARLENELAVAVGTDLSQQRLFEENSRLRELLSVSDTRRIAAAVTARPHELPYDLLQIDQGSEAGVVEGAPVYIGVDNVIGVVTSVAAGYSFVELFTTPGFFATAFISGPDVMTTLEGFGGGVARVSVPQGVPLAVGNLVYVPSIEPGVFGRIAYVENRPSQPEQYGYITLPKPIAGIRYVAVASQAMPVVSAPVVEERVRTLMREALIIDTAGFTIASTSATTTSTTTASLPPTP